MSNAYPWRFLDLLGESEGPVLDCGSGDRCLPGVVTLDLGSGMVHADALDLPFADDTFALVLSQAVVEHVTEPQRYIDEVTRVLKPGGLLYVEAAFMQPIHMAPMHYFNVTPFGLAHLCRHLETLESGPIGALTETWAWWVRDLGITRWVDDTGMAAVWDALAAVDANLSREEYASVASGVTLLGRKR